MNTINEPPQLDSFTPISEHQSQTPSSFYNAKPVLHYHGVGARAIGESLPILSAESNIVDIYVTSENLTLFNPSLSKGVTIPYPSISLHAIQRLPDPADPESLQGLYMQLNISDSDESPGQTPVDEDTEMASDLELTLIPTSPADIQPLFEAVSNCADLHPDPAGDEEAFEGTIGYEGALGGSVIQGVSDGGLPPPFPGSGGWITAENVGEYLDEEGNWIGGEGEGGILGEGAGRVRTRDESDNNVNGHNGEEEGEESKRARTD